MAIIALLSLIGGNVFAAALLTENFTYTPGTNLNGQGGWSAHSGAGTNPITVATPGLSYSNYLGSGVGNRIGTTTSGEDDNHGFAAQTSGSVYASFMLNVTATQTTGDYFVHFFDGAIAGNLFRARLLAKKDPSSTNYALGIQSSSNAGSLIYTGFSHAPATTHLVVVKYTFVAGPTNDQIALFVDPVVGGVEPAATLTTSTTTGEVDATNIDGIAIRQGTAANAATAQIDGIRVATNWADAVGPPDHTITASAGAGGSISPNGPVIVADGASQPFIISPDPCKDIADVLVDGGSVGPVSSYTFTNVTADHTIAASFGPAGYTITASVGEGGSISPNGAVSVECGSNVFFAISPDSAHALEDVLVDGVSVGAVSGYQFTNVTANHSISASFAPCPPNCPPPVYPVLKVTKAYDADCCWNFTLSQNGGAGYPIKEVTLQMLTPGVAITSAPSGPRVTTMNTLQTVKWIIDNNGLLDGAVTVRVCFAGIDGNNLFGEANFTAKRPPGDTSPAKDLLVYDPYLGDEYLCFSPACAAPPSGMIAWWSLNELAPSIYYTDLIKKAWPFKANGSPAHVTGHVRNSLEFITTSQYLESNGTNLYNITGDFTIDAWIKMNPSADPRDRVIVEKRGTIGSYADGVGYTFFIKDMNKLALRIGNDTNANQATYLSPVVSLNDGNWHFVAVSVKRSSALYFVFGNLAFASTNPVLSAGFPLVNNGKMRAAVTAYGGPVPFNGAIDEIEIFNRAFDNPSDLRAIGNADATGKCVSPACALRWQTWPFVIAFEQSKTTLVIYNPDPYSTHDYDWTIVGLPAAPSSGGGTVDGPSTFYTTDYPAGISPAAPGVALSVSAGGTRSILIRFSVPPWTANANQTATFQVTVRDRATGQVTSCVGNIRHIPPAKKFDGNPAASCCTQLAPQSLGDGYLVVPEGDVGQATFTVKNTGDTSANFSYAITGMQEDADSIGTSIIRLNGLPPGTPVVGSVNIPAHDSTDVGVSVSFSQSNPLTFYDVILSSQLDDVGPLEEMTSIMVRSAANDSLVLGVDPTGGNSRGRLALRAPWPNPFSGSTTLRLSVPRRGQVKVVLYDVGGRLVRRLVDRVVDAGELSVSWDGLSDGRERVADGVYFVEAWMKSSGGEDRLKGRVVFVK